MKAKAASFLSKIVYALLAVCLTWAVAAVFVNNFYSYSPIILALLSSAAFLMIVSAWLFIRKNETFFTKHIRLFTLGFFLFMGAIQIAMIFPLRYKPVFDVDALFGGAAEWTTTGDFTSYHVYFGMFHNNWGGLLLLRLVFGLAKLLGISNFYLVASIFNSALSLSTMYLTGSVCQKLIGVRGRVMAYFLFTISLPFYFIAPAFYTDALTMVFPILILRLYLAAREQKNTAKRLLAFALMGIAAGVGYGIKATVIIMLIAVVIDAVLFWDFKKYAPLIPISVIAVLLCSLAVQGAIYRHLDRSEAERFEIPILHWVMMGTAGNGFYNGDEYEFTKSFADPAERETAVKERLQERLKSYGVRDYAGLFTVKLDIDFGDGTYGLSDCLGGKLKKSNALHEFLLNNGAHRDAYKHICTGVLVALYVLLIASCVLDVIRTGPTLKMLAPRLALFGLLLFLLFWEARWQYFSNYVPVIMVSAVIGLDQFACKFGKRKVKCNA